MLLFMSLSVLIGIRLTELQGENVMIKNRFTYTHITIIKAEKLISIFLRDIQKLGFQ